MAATALAGAMLAIGDGMDNYGAGALGEQLGLAVADGYRMLKWQEDGCSEPVAHEAAEAEASRLAMDAISKFGSDTLSAVEHNCSYLLAALDTTQNAVRLALLNRYKKGDRSMDQYHIDKLTQVERRVDGGIEGITSIVAELMGHFNTEKRVPRDSIGNPIMRPSSDVS